MPVIIETQPPERHGPGPLPLVIFFLLGLLLGISILYEPKKPTTPPPDTSSLSAELERIRESITQLQASRCMTVNTPILQMSVYSTPNIGTKPVPTYDKSVEKGKENVRKVQEANGGPQVPH